MYVERTNYSLSGLEIEIDNGDYAQLDSSWKNEKVCDPFSRLYYIKDGEGEIGYRGEIIKLLPGYVYLIPAECEFSYLCESYLEKIFFHIYVNTLERYDLLANVKKVCEIPFDTSEFEELKMCLETNDYIKLIKLRRIIYDTIYKMSEKYSFGSVPIKNYSDGVKKAMKYIHRHTRISLNTEIISENLFISQSKLRKDFKRETGVSIGKYIDDMVFLKAKRLLSKGYLSINEISQKLGFCDQFYFSRRFKERYGEPPSSYRKKIMNEKNEGE